MSAALLLCFCFNNLKVQIQLPFFLKKDFDIEFVKKKSKKAPTKIQYPPPKQKNPQTQKKTPKTQNNKNDYKGHVWGQEKQNYVSLSGSKRRGKRDENIK